jgi:hypothetical protein
MAAQQPRGLRLSYARLHSARATVGITPRPGALPALICEECDGARSQSYRQGLLNYAPFGADLPVGEWKEKAD